MCEKCDNFVAGAMIVAGVEQVKRWDNTKESLEVIVGRIYSTMQHTRQELIDAMDTSRELYLAGRLN